MRVRHPPGNRDTGYTLAYTVQNEAGVIVATGTLTTGSVTSKRPSYRCTTEEQVALSGPAKFVQVEFANGQRAMGQSIPHWLLN
jgi:hypothetical protein